MAAQAIPPDGYVMFQTLLLYDGLLYQPAASAGTEIVWPDKSGVNTRHPEPPHGHEAWVHHSDLSTGFGSIVSHYEGSLVEITMTCPPEDRWYRLSHLPYDESSNPTGSALKLRPAELLVPVTGSVYIHCDPTFSPPGVGGFASAPDVLAAHDGASIRGWLLAAAATGVLATLVVFAALYWRRRT